MRFQKVERGRDVNFKLMAIQEDNMHKHNCSTYLRTDFKRVFIALLLNLIMETKNHVEIDSLICPTLKHMWK